jgi:isopentenyl phosphate kinase
MSERILLKLGGSVVTEKGRASAIDEGRVLSIAWEIGKRPEKEYLLVHGAGSCGHPEAHEYGIASGVNRSNRKGIAITHQAVLALNREIVKHLREAGVDAVGISPLQGCLADKGRIHVYEHRHLAGMIGLGIVPVLHGDVVMDCTRGACIISGDQLVQYLAVRMGPDRIGLATDVAGILEGDRVIPSITPGRFDPSSIGSSGHTDVTGGMRGKVEELMELARSGRTSEIFHVSRLSDFLDGRPHGGTVVKGGD